MVMIGILNYLFFISNANVLVDIIRYINICCFLYFEFQFGGPNSLNVINLPVDLLITDVFYITLCNNKGVLSVLISSIYYIFIPP